MFNHKRLNRWVEELPHEPELEKEKQKRHEKPKKTNRKNKKKEKKVPGEIYMENHGRLSWCRGP